MNAEIVFLKNGEVRPVWRFLLSVLLVVAAVFGVGAVLALLFGILDYQPSRVLLLGASGLLLFPALLGVFKYLTASLDQKPLGSAGLVFLSGWKPDLGRGLALGAAMILAVGGIEALFGLARFSWGGEPAGRALAWGLFFFGALVFAAANEEMIFRGYPFQRLLDAAGVMPAVVLSSFLFGLAHLSNPSATWVSTLNTALVGVPFAVAYLRTRMLWLPIGIHFAWNFLQGFVLGLPVSGFQMPVTLLHSSPQGPKWLTGGAYGPEGGVLATAAIFAVTAYLFLSRSIYIREDTKNLVDGVEPPGAGAGDLSSLTSTE